MRKNVRRAAVGLLIAGKLAAAALMWRHCEVKHESIQRLLREEQDRHFKYSNRGESMQINNDQHFIQSFLNKVVDGRKITAKDRAIYNLALLYEFKRAFPEKARFIKEKDKDRGD